ncbi:MAG: glycosyltransferase family 2 protein, partial [Ignavibacteria bacterium]
MMNEIVEHHTLPIVSIIVPCYNAEKYILETLQSIQRIEYPSWECIIINDGSTDNSLNVIKEAIDGN